MVITIHNLKKRIVYLRNMMTAVVPIENRLERDYHAGLMALLQDICDHIEYVQSGKGGKGGSAGR